MLKTTQSGYEGFLHDKYTLLKDTKERIVATAITSTWRCAACTSDARVSVFCLTAENRHLQPPCCQSSAWQQGG